jgi:hypothetical protein
VRNKAADSEQVYKPLEADGLQLDAELRSWLESKLECISNRWRETIEPYGWRFVNWNSPALQQVITPPATAADYLFASMFYF